MANVADVAPVPGQTQAEPPARTSIRGLFAQTEIDLRLFGMLVALVVILRHVQHPERRDAHPADQHGHDGRPGGGHRDHRDRHGPGHRVAQHRPVGRVARRPHRHDVRAADDRLAPARPRDRGRRPVPVGPRPRPRDRRSARRSARSRASSSPTSASRRSSSRSAGCCRSAASIWYQSQGAAVTGPRPDVPADRRRRARARSASTITWILGVVGCVAIVALLVQQPAAATALRLPDRGRCGRRSLLGVVGCGDRARAGLVRQQRLLAEGPRRPVRDRPRHHRAARRPADPDRVPVPDHPPHRRDARDDVHREPPPVRALRVRLRRQPRRRRAGRHQHALDDPEDLRADGHPVRARRGDRRGPAQRRDARHRRRATSCTSSPRRSSAARRSPAASGRSRAPSSARSSCSRWPTA